MTHRSRTIAALFTLLAATGSPLSAQTSGALAGTVRDAVSGRGIAEAVVLIGDGRRGATTDTSGSYRVREVRSGWYRVSVRAIGYRPAVRDSVLVRSGETTVLDLALSQAAVQLDSLVAVAPVDPVLDPFVTQSEQRITAEEIRLRLDENRVRLDDRRKCIGSKHGHVR